MKYTRALLFASALLLAIGCTETTPENVTDSLTNPIEEITVNGISFKMIRVEGGTFTMGATPEQGNDAIPPEKPAHQVTLSDYYIGQMEVTQQLWEMVMASFPSQHVDNPMLPVECVSWNDVVNGFLPTLNKATGLNFTLPTEAQWEFAARGGNKSKGYKYSGSNSIDEVAWYQDNSGNETHPVGQKKPNELGIYDMSGNVWEWCSDRYGDYRPEAQTNPVGPANGSGRVLRGGTFDVPTEICRIPVRLNGKIDGKNPKAGFRLALAL